MNKLKHLFAKPLISSNPKISPLTSDTIEQQETTKPEDLVTSQATEIARGRYLQKAHSSFPSKPALRQKKNSLPSTIQKAPEKDTGFDFEQFEELVDKRKLGFHKELTNCGDDDKGGKAPRRHSWSAHDQGLSSKHNVEMMKKLKLPALNINQNPINNVNMIPSPSIRSPLNQSRVDESANLLGEAGENSRKEYVLSPADSFEEPKLNKRKSSMATVVSGGRRGSQKAPSLAQRGEFENLEVEISKEEKIPSNKENKMEAFDPEDPVEDENRGEVGGENSEDQRDMFKRLSAKLAMTQRFEKAEGAAGKIPSVNELESSDSNLDSLVEENPFEDEMTVRARTTSFKRLKTRLRDDKRYAKVKWTLFPDDLGRRIWDFVIGGALIYTALIMPVRVGFMTDDTDDYTWPAIDWSIDGIFLIDIIITFFTAYFDGEENLIIEKKKIFMHYLTGWFVLDILSVAPFYLISDLDESSQRLNNLVRVARLPRLYKLIKIIKLVRMIKIIKDRDKFMSYMNTILKLNAAYERLAVGVVFIFLFCHISACLWYLFVGLGDSPDDWLTSNELDSIPKLDQYIASFYFVVQTMVTVGYGDLSPKTKEERLLSCFLMVIGVLFYSIFIGFVSSLISDMDAMNQKFNHKLHILHRLQKDYNLPVFFVKKLKKAIRFESKQTIDSKLFVDHLPKQLSVELFCVMHKDIIDSIAFLQNRPKAFIAALCPLLKPITINKRDTVFTEGDPADEIFFVKSGTVGYVLPKYKNECFLKIREGYFFGEIDLLFYGEIRKYTAVALKDCELYVLNKKEFKQLFLTSYREIGQALCENAYKRKQRTRKAYKEALKICQERHEDAAKHKKLRLTVTKRDKFAYDNSESDDSDDELPNALMGIVEEENEEEEEHIIEPTPEEEIEKIEEIVETQKTFGHGSGVSRLKAALMLKKAFAHKTGMRNSLISPKEVIKEEQKFGELNRKIDGLESKLGKLMSIGKRIKSSSFKDLNNPSVLAENPQKSSFGLSRLIQTPSNKGLLIQTDSSPTNSNTIESPLSTFRSPNALRRNLKKQGEVSGIKQFSSANRFGFASPSNAPEMDSERFNLFTGRSANREGTYGDVKTVANSEHDPMIITEHNYEMREDDEVESRKTSGEEEKQAEKKEDSAPQPLLKLILNLGRKNAKIEKDDSFRTSASQFSPPEITKTKSGLQVEDF